jgi:hypothetical protein
MQLPVALGDDFTQLILLLFCQGINVDTVEKTLGEDFLHETSFIETVAGPSPTIGGTDHRSEAGLVCNCTCSTLTSFHSIWMSR